MSGTDRSKLASSVMTIIVCSSLAACQCMSRLSEDDEVMPGTVEIQGEGGDIVSRVRASREETAWPDGWLIVHHEEWLPVLDDLGRRLHAARRAFQTGDRRTTTNELRRGLSFLRAQTIDASDQDRAALESAIATLEMVTQRINEDEEVTLEQLDIALTNAYRRDLERDALIIETGATAPYLELPERHLQLALERFLATGEEEEASREIERASAFLRLEGNRRELAERAQLIESAQNLEYLAARIRLFEIRDRAELDHVFGPAIQQWRQATGASNRPRILGLAAH